MRSVGYISEHGYFGTAIDPSNIIGNAPVHHDLCTGHPHTSEALSYRTVDRDLDHLVTGPYTAANTMLAFSQDMEIPISIPYRLLDLFLENT
jgi:hypothetical protein